MFRNLCLLILAMLLTTAGVRADEPAVQREVYVLRQAAAGGLADVLAKLYKGEAAVQIMAAPGGNSLLVSAPAKISVEIRKLVEQLDRPPHTVAINVLLVDLPPVKKGAEPKEIDTKELTGRIDDVVGKLQALQKKGEISGIRRFEMMTLESTTGKIGITESRPFVVGSTVTGMGQVRHTITYRDLGTTMSVVPLLGPGDTVLLDVDVKDSHVNIPEDGIAVGPNDKGGENKAAEFINLTLNTKLTIPSGQTVLARMMQTDMKGPQARTLALVSARIVEAGAKPK
jgi:type II secretory pathway component GspD/PulD (secretin)